MGVASASCGGERSSARAVSRAARAGATGGRTRARCDRAGRGRGREGRRGARATRARAARGDGRRVCEVYDVSRAITAYDEAWAWQRGFLRRALDAGEAAADAALLVQHAPVYTLGAGSDVGHLKFDPAAPPSGFDVRRCERGGEATYHGPGQLVLYPVVNLDAGGRERDLHAHMRALEEVALRTMIELGCDAEKCGRVDGLTGAWCDGHKLAAVGVRARRWVSYHGVALNVCPDLSHFANIVPCGIDDRPVGSVRQILLGETGVVSGKTTPSAPAAPSSAAVEDDVALMARAREAMIRAFASVFHVDVIVRTRAPRADEFASPPVVL